MVTQPNLYKPAIYYISCSLAHCSFVCHIRGGGLYLPNCFSGEEVSPQASMQGKIRSKNREGHRFPFCNNWSRVSPPSYLFRSTLPANNQSRHTVFNIHVVLYIRMVLVIKPLSRTHNHLVLDSLARICRQSTEKFVCVPPD